ncbi:MAG: hypothetical protein NVS3B29_00690 [Candidatus Saccharimonadales bacterium]
MLAYMLINKTNLVTTTQQHYILWNGLTFATGDILVFISLIILAYTALQALKARKATAQAAILSVLPILLVEYETTEHSDLVLRLRNEGHGPAFGILIEDIVLDFLDIKQRWRMKLNLRPDHLLAGESRLLGTQVTDIHGKEGG